MHLLLNGSDVKYKVRVAGWERDNCIGVDLSCDGWRKHFRIPISQVENEDVRAVIGQIAKQSEGAIVVQEHSIQMIESEGLVH